MIIHTFVICAYKESSYLEKSIKSCMSQVTVKNNQSNVIVYTSTPNRHIFDICKKYNLELFIGNRKSIGSDWNQALENVKTPYATIVHQDDIYFENYGSLVLQQLLKYEETNIVFTDYVESNEKGEIKPRNLNLKIKTFGLSVLSVCKIKWFQRRVYGFGNFICCPAVSYNMVKLRKCDFKFNEDLKMVVDWDAWERIMSYPGKITFLKNRAMAHRIHRESETTANTQDHNRENEELMMFQRYWPRFIAKGIMYFYVNNQKSNK